MAHDNSTNLHDDDIDMKSISFFIISEKHISQSFFHINIFVFYTTYVYTIARLFRGVFVPKTSNIPITDA